MLSGKANTANPIGAFQTKLAGDDVVLSAGAPIIFNTVAYNPGGEYDPSIGSYTCPLNGTYVYHLTVLGVTSFAVFIMKSGVEQARFLTGNVAHQTGALGTIFHCTEGENVNVILPSGGTVRCCSYANFGGYLLHADPL